jgi:uncharacterized protein (TIGR02265 family)
LETFGRYQLIRKIATGGMGQIFLARQLGPASFEKLLVLKRILPHLAEEEEFIDMFFDEARIAAALNHPNIVQIYELGDVKGTPFIAMEYVQGDPIRAVAERAAASSKTGMPMALKLRVIADAAAGLDFAHRAKSSAGKPLGLIHRDVSPHNILVGVNGAVKLVDFGVAKAAGKISQTNTGAIKGKYAYMSPEQARGEELDPRSDIFALGIVLHELLTGQRLFRKDTETGTLRAVVQARVPAPSNVSKTLPKSLDPVVLKALAKKPEERYQTAGELQLALEDFLLEQHLPATSAHLASFMRDLYPEALRDDVFGDAAPPPSEAGTQSKARGDTAGKTPSKRRPTFDEIADERVGRTRVALPREAPARPAAPKAVPTVFDIGQLDARLSAAKDTDRVSGIFFNAVLRAVTRYAGPIAEPHVREAAGENRQYLDAFPYATSEFLRLLWKAGEVMAPVCESADQPFIELGRACVDALLEAPSGRTLSSRMQPAEPLWVLNAAVATLQALVSPGERKVEPAGPNEAILTSAGEVLPSEMLVGLVDRCLARLADRPAVVAVEKATLEWVELRARW